MISLENVYTDLEVDNKADCIKFLADKSFEIGLSSSSLKIEQDILAREELMSTALLSPIAIPHAKSMYVLKNNIIFLKTKDYFDWDSTKVKLVFGIFAKEGDNNVHIETLAKLSRNFVKKDFIDFLLNSDRDQIVKKLNDIMGVKS